ncbi:MAG: ferredoxin [Waddliaceae bacterium]|nr:ferredoxin [Waddliaceae bacterium]
MSDIKDDEKAKIIFEHSGEEIDLPIGSEIQEICEEAGVPFACTEGVCGTCVIEIVDGHECLSTPTQEEVDFLGEEVEETGEERLACQCRIKQKGTITLRF